VEVHLVCVCVCARAAAAGAGVRGCARRDVWAGGCSELYIRTRSVMLTRRGGGARRGSIFAFGDRINQIKHAERTMALHLGSARGLCVSLFCVTTLVQQGPGGAPGDSLFIPFALTPDATLAMPFYLLVLLGAPVNIGEAFRPAWLRRISLSCLRDNACTCARTRTRHHMVI